MFVLLNETFWADFSKSLILCDSYDTLLPQLSCSKTFLLS